MQAITTTYQCRHKTRSIEFCMPVMMRRRTALVVAVRASEDDDGSVVVSTDTELDRDGVSQVIEIVIARLYPGQNTRQSIHPL